MANSCIWASRQSRQECGTSYGRQLASGCRKDGKDKVRFGATMTAIRDFPAIVEPPIGSHSRGGRRLVGQ